MLTQPEFIYPTLIQAKLIQNSSIPKYQLNLDQIMELPLLQAFLGFHHQPDGGYLYLITFV